MSADNVSRAAVLAAIKAESATWAGDYRKAAQAALRTVATAVKALPSNPPDEPACELADDLAMFASMIRENAADPQNGLPYPNRLDDWLTRYRGYHRKVTEPTS